MVHHNLTVRMQRRETPRAILGGHQHILGVAFVAYVLS